MKKSEYIGVMRLPVAHILVGRELSNAIRPRGARHLHCLFLTRIMSTIPIRWGGQFGPILGREHGCIKCLYQVWNREGESSVWKVLVSDFIERGMELCLIVWRILGKSTGNKTNFVCFLFLFAGHSPLFASKAHKVFLAVKLYRDWSFWQEFGLKSRAGSKIVAVSVYPGSLAAVVRTFYKIGHCSPEACPALSMAVKLWQRLVTSSIARTKQLL